MVPIVKLQKAFICVRYSLRRSKGNGVSGLDVAATTDRVKFVLGDVWAKAAVFTVPA